MVDRRVGDPGALVAFVPISTIRWSGGFRDEEYRLRFMPRR